MAGIDFSAKLDLVLKALSMSRGRLAADLGVDKSLVGRWVSGSVRPSSHNLSLLTAVIARRKAGFTMVDWERDLTGLADFFGVDASVLSGKAPPAPASTSSLFPFASEAMNARETGQTAHMYVGHYALFHPAITRPDGAVSLMVCRLWLEDGRLRSVWSLPYLDINHWVMVLRDRPWFLGESEDARTGLTLAAFNGIGAGRAMVMDGLLLGTASDRFQTVSASRCLLLRVAHALDDPGEDKALHEAMVGRTQGHDNYDLAARFLPPAYAHVLDNGAGFTRTPDAERVLRIGETQTVSASNIDLGTSDFPAAEARAFLLGG